MKGERAALRGLSPLRVWPDGASEGQLGAVSFHCFLRLVPHRSISIMKVAQAKLKEIGPDDMNMDEYKVKSFL